MKYITHEIVAGVIHNITWEATGEEIERIDAYDWDEWAEGIDQFGNKWKGFAQISIGEIVDIIDPELELN